MRHFTISEMLHSDTAVRRRLWNGAGRAEEEALRALVDAVLDPLREAWGRPIAVTSGYRCKRLNQMVGGAPTSQHMRGEAADVTAGSAGANRELARLAVRLGLPFGQLINENGYSWVHISHSATSTNKRQILKFANGKYTSITYDDL